MIARFASAILAVADQDQMIAFFVGKLGFTLVTDDGGYPRTFACDDLAGTVVELRAAGVEVTDPVTESGGSYVQVTDPEGRQLLVNDRA